MPINPDACNGPCNRRYREAVNAYDLAVDQHARDIQQWLDTPADDRGPRPVSPEAPTTPFTHGDPVWCSRDSRLIDRALGHISDTASIIAADIDGYRGGTAAGPNGMAAPDHKSLIGTLDKLYGYLVSVEDDWRAARGHEPRPTRARGSHARHAAISYLADQLGDILLDPWSVEVGLRILSWERVLLYLAKADPVTRRSPIRCPRCRERQVSRRDDYYECVCGKLMTREEHDREYAEQADEHDHEQQEVAAS